MARKALFFDIDGTLLSEITREIPKSALEAVARARAAGNLVYINSGRTWGFMGDIKDKIVVDGYLCGCGTCVMEHQEMIFRHQIPVELGREIRRRLPDFRVDAILEAADGLYSRGERSWIPGLRRLQEAETKENKITKDRWEDENLIFDKFCVWTDENSDVEGMKAFLETDFDVIDRGNHFFEIVPKGFTKATAIEWVLEHYGIEKKDAYVFGDSSNDLAMFVFSENAILMGEHDPVLEPYATFVTKKVEEDGIAYAMEQLGLCDRE